MPRSGSNRLHTLLNSHPAVVCHGELFQRRTIYSAVGPWPELSAAGRFAALVVRDMAPRRFLERQVSEAGHVWPDAEAIGFKLFPYHSRRILRHVCASRAYRVIYLKRNNRVLQYASDRIARASNVWTSTGPGRPGGPVEKVEFSMRDFSRYVARHEHYDRIVRCALGDKPFMEIAYEELEARLPAIQDFLGVDVLDTLESSVQRQNPGDWAQRFSNPEHVLEALGPTKWAVHLQ